MTSSVNYDHYISFAKQHIVKRGIDSAFVEHPNPSVLKMLNESNQGLIVSELILKTVLYVSDSFRKLLGYDDENFPPGFFLTIVHPDDLNRFTIAHNRIFENGQEILAKSIEYYITSSSFRMKTKQGGYITILYQCFSFIQPSEKESVGNLSILTDISNFADKSKCNHHYFGQDKKMFRAPDVELLNTECILSRRELEVVKLIIEGYTSEQVGEKLFLSYKTVNTHRSNVLKKLNATNLMESVKKLKQMGLI